MLWHHQMSLHFPSHVHIRQIAIHYLINRPLLIPSMTSFSAGNSFGNVFVIPKWVTDATYFGVGQTKHFGISDIANWARAAPQRYCRTWRMNQCCMFLILITFMNGHCLGAQNPTVICDHLIPSVIEFKIELLHTNLFLQYLNAPSSSSAWSWSKWVRWITPLMSSTIGRTAGRRRGKFIPLSIPLHHLWTWTSHLISRLWLAQP